MPGQYGPSADASSVSCQHAAGFGGMNRVVSPYGIPRKAATPPGCTRPAMSPQTVLVLMVGRDAAAMEAAATATAADAAAIHTAQVSQVEEILEVSQVSQVRLHTSKIFSAT